jgi:hypothetical protein
MILLMSLSYDVVGVEDEGHYGVDVSFPIHHHWTESSTPLNDERKVVYENFMDGCRKKYGSRGKLCDETENDRIAMSLRQPQSMVNYTSTGFKKIRAPEALRKLLIAHWERNKDNKQDEKWNAGNIYVNHWESETYMVGVEDSKLRGGGSGLKQRIWDAAKDTIEQWTGMELQQTSLYGIRVYTEGKPQKKYFCIAPNNHNLTFCRPFRSHPFSARRQVAPCKLLHCQRCSRRRRTLAA